MMLSPPPAAASQSTRTKKASNILDESNSRRRVMAGPCFLKVDMGGRKASEEDCPGSLGPSRDEFDSHTVMRSEMVCRYGKVT